MFSSRFPANLAPNRVTEALRARRDNGDPLIDLTESNPTRAGFEYPADLLVPLADSRGLAYVPEAMGALAARQAVANDFARRRVAVSPDRVMLTVSTSDAYSVLFKLLCDPGDEVLIPQPSYPLFDHLTKSTGGDIKWNFNKFLIGKKGEILGRFEPPVEPTAPELVKAIETALG